jgi:hypothetical protein
MITLWDYVWNTNLIHQMSFDEIDQALIEARKLNLSSGQGYWTKQAIIEDLQKHLKPEYA